MSGFLVMTCTLDTVTWKTQAVPLNFRSVASYTGAMKSYNQTCSIAGALDMIGDRWTLLVLRELLLQGPCRYTDVANGLPGIATSVLADRLRSLEEAGLISRELAPPPVATTLFHLTDQGRAVEPVLVALARWGTDNADASGPDAEFRSHWFPFAASAYLRDHTSDGPPVVIQLETPIGTGVIAVTKDGVKTRVGTMHLPTSPSRERPGRSWTSCPARRRCQRHVVRVCPSKATTRSLPTSQASWRPEATPRVDPRGGTGDEPDPVCTETLQVVQPGRGAGQGRRRGSRRRRTAGKSGKSRRVEPVRYRGLDSGA